RLRQPLHNGIEESSQVRLGIESATKLYESFAVIESLLIEDAVDPGLNCPLQWIEDDAGHDNGRHQAPDAKALQTGMYQFRQHCDNAEIKTHQRCGRQRIS